MTSILKRLATRAKTLHASNSDLLNSGIHPLLPSRFEGLDDFTPETPTTEFEVSTYSEDSQAPIAGRRNTETKHPEQNAKPSPDPATKSPPNFVTENLTKEQIFQRPASVERQSPHLMPPALATTPSNRIEKQVPQLTKTLDRADNAAPQPLQERIERVISTEDVGAVSLTREDEENQLLPSRLQPFIAPDFSSQPTPSAVHPLEIPFEVTQNSASSPPDIVIQISHIDIQVEKPKPQPRRKEARKLHLTDLSSYLSEQGDRR